MYLLTHYHDVLSVLYSPGRPLIYSNKEGSSLSHTFSTKLDAFSKGHWGKGPLISGVAV